MALGRQPIPRTDNASIPNGNISQSSTLNSERRENGHNRDNKTPKDTTGTKSTWLAMFCYIY